MECIFRISEELCYLPRARSKSAVYQLTAVENQLTIDQVCRAVRIAAFLTLRAYLFSCAGTVESNIECRDKEARVRSVRFTIIPVVLITQ